MKASTISYLISGTTLVAGGALIYSGLGDQKTDEGKAKIKEVIGTALLLGGVSLTIGTTVKILSQKPKSQRYFENPTKRLCPSSSRVQTLIFPKHFGVSKAKRWAKQHGFHTKKVDITADSIRIRQEPPSHFDRMRTISMGHGVRAVIGWPRC